MDKIDLIVGVDVSCDTLSMSVYNGKNYKYFDTKYTFKEIEIKILSELKKFNFKKQNILFAMECTEIYHLRLANSLYKLGYKVSTINPYIVKQYANMKMKRVKTDSVDCKIIASYAEEMH